MRGATGTGALKLVMNLQICGSLCPHRGDQEVRHLAARVQVERPLVSVAVQVMARLPCLHLELSSELGDGVGSSSWDGNSRRGRMPRIEMTGGAAARKKAKEEVRARRKQMLQRGVHQLAMGTNGLLVIFTGFHG